MRQVPHTLTGRKLFTFFSMILLLAGHSVTLAVNIDGEGGGGGGDADPPALPYTTDANGNVTIHTAPDEMLTFDGVNITYLGTVNQTLEHAGNYLLQLNNSQDKQITINVSASLTNPSTGVIKMANGGTLLNYGTLISDSDTVYGAQTFNNMAGAVIESETSDAVNISPDVENAFVNNEGSIIAGDSGIDIDGTPTTVHNNGLIEGQIVGVFLDGNYCTIINQENGEIKSSQTAILAGVMNNSLTKTYISNANLIETDFSQHGLDEVTPGYSAILTGNEDLDNTGQIIGKNAFGITQFPSGFGSDYFNTELGTSTINNAEGALIQSDVIAIQSYDDDLVINNDGTIKRTAADDQNWLNASDGFHQAAIQSEAQLVLNNNATGLIESDVYAIKLMPTTPAMLDSDDYDIDNHDPATIVNKGSIRVTDEEGYAIHTTGRGLDLTLHTGSYTGGKIAFDSNYVAENQLTLTGDGLSRVYSQIEGQCSILKTGSGQWSINYTDDPIDTTGGQIEVRDGRLNINTNVYIDSSLYVRSGATLGGSARLYSFDETDTAQLVIENNATLAFGDDLLTGFSYSEVPVVFEDGSTMQVQIGCMDSDNQFYFYDFLGTQQLIVGENTTLNIIDISSEGNAIAPGKITTVVYSATPIDNAFTQVTDNSAILDFEQIIGYSSENILDDSMPYTLSVQAIKVSCYDDHAKTNSQHAVAKCLDQAQTDGKMTDLTGKLNPLSADQLRKEFKRLQPNVSPMQTIFSNAQQVSTDTFRAAHLARSSNTNPGLGMMAQLADEPFTLAQNNEAAEPVDTANKLHVYASPFGQFGEINEADNRTGYNFEAYGAIFGIDYQCLPNTAMGLSLGYINTDIGMDDNFGDSNVNTLRFGPYATYENGPWTLDASLTGGIHWIDANRNTINGKASADYNSYDITIYGAANYDIQLGDWLLTPTASLTYIHQMTDSYTESGAGSANLNVEDLDTDSLQSLIGMHVSRNVMLGDIALTPEAWLGWKYEWLDQDVDINAAFTSNAATSFTSSSDGTARSQLVTGAAVASQLNDITKLKCNYEWQTSADASIHTVWAMIEVDF